MSDNCCRIPVAICKLCKNSQIPWSLAHYQMQPCDVQVISSGWADSPELGEQRGNLLTLNSTFIFRFFIQQRIFNFGNYGGCKRTYLRTSCNRFHLTIGAKLGWFPIIIAHLIIVVKIVPSSLSTCQINQGACGRMSSVQLQGLGYVTIVSQDQGMPHSHWPWRKKFFTHHSCFLFGSLVHSSCLKWWSCLAVLYVVI